MGLSVETYVLAKNYTDSVIDSGAGGVVPNITMTAVPLEPGEEPTVVKGGTNVNPTFELGIPQGEQGPRGIQGQQGIQGTTGATGPQGPAGPKGDTGAQGIQGPIGQTGPQGPKGDAGEAGPVGPAGAQGPQGPKGDQGTPFLIAKIYATQEDMNNGYATDGLQQGELVAIATDTGGERGGWIYAKGPTQYDFFYDISTTEGIQGPQGPQGKQGPQGEQGPVGPMGPQGPQGDQGPQGLQGEQGPVGPSGANGVDGATGPQGPQGEQGIQGEPGVGVPTGGNTGQVLAKASDNDYDMVWVDQSGGGGGGDIVLQSIEITTPPNKVTYNAGEVFDNTGMLVTAYYNFGLSQTVTGYTISPSGALTGEITEITVNYSEGGIVKNTTYPITVNRNTGIITINPNTIFLDENTQSTVVEVVYNGDGELTVENTNPSLVSAELSDGSMTIKSLGNTSEVVTITVGAPETGYYTAASEQVFVNNYISTQIYGVLWDGTSSSKFSRTDAAELFEDPNPAVNNGTGSSPFDNIMPWAGMKRVTDPVAGELVEIPKFWYKWTRTGASMQLQIANGETEGFYVSPAHADRGDGQGERDFVYVGRYPCDSEYKSTTGQIPLGSISRQTARSKISGLGEEYWQFDYAMLWTIRMLYLVEFADWNSQNMIGYGNNFLVNTGATDEMKYSTGTNVESVEVKGSCQYRYIESLWDNIYFWCDGLFFSGTSIYCINTPEYFTDSINSNTILIGYRPSKSGWVSAWTDNPTVEGYEYAIYPDAVNGSETTYITDQQDYSSTGTQLRIGGSESGFGVGMFVSFGNNAVNYTVSNLGCRLQKLPNNS